MASKDIPVINVAEGKIRLGQFLKWANFADSGSQARELIVAGDVKVNGEVETRRGAQLNVGAVVEVYLPGGVLAGQVGSGAPEVDW